LNQVGDGYKSVDVETTFIVVPCPSDKQDAQDDNCQKFQIINDITGGKTVSLEKFLEEQRAPGIKVVKQMSTCRGALTIGDADQLGAVLRMNVWVYNVNMESKFPSMGKVVSNTNGIDESLLGHKAEMTRVYTYKEPKDEIEEGQVTL